MNPFKRHKKAAPPTPEERAEAALGQLRRLLAFDDLEGSLELIERTRRDLPSFELPEEELMSLIKRLDAEKRVSESIPFMDDYIRRFPEKASRIRLRLARYLVDGKRPARALLILDGIVEGSLPEKLMKIRDQIQLEAEETMEEGEIELDGPMCG